MLLEYQRLLDDCKLELNNISNWIAANKLDSNIKYLVGYSVIKACGTIEIIFKSMIYNFLAEKSRDETKQYLNKMIVESSCNPNVGNISKILEQFDGKKSIKFNEKLKGTKKKGDLTSLVNLRNDLAHGRTINSSINNIQEYFMSGKEILLILDDVLSSNT